MTVVSIGWCSLKLTCCIYRLSLQLQHIHVFFHSGAVDVDPHQQFHLTVKLEFFEEFALTAPQVDHLKGGVGGSIRTNEITTYCTKHAIASKIHMQTF